MGSVDPFELIVSYGQDDAPSFIKVSEMLAEWKMSVEKVQNGPVEEYYYLRDLHWRSIIERVLDDQLDDEARAVVAASLAEIDGLLREATRPDPDNSWLRREREEDPANACSWWWFRLPLHPFA